jgi:hypothetical protein
MTDTLFHQLLPNPTFVDYQVPHNGQGADFYNDERMIEYGRRIVQECQRIIEQIPDYHGDYRDQITQAARTECVNQIQFQFGIKS